MKIRSRNGPCSLTFSLLEGIVTRGTIYFDATRIKSSLMGQILRGWSFYTWFYDDDDDGPNVRNNSNELKMPEYFWRF